MPAVSTRAAMAFVSARTNCVTAMMTVGTAVMRAVIVVSLFYTEHLFESMSLNIELVSADRQSLECSFSDGFLCGYTQYGRNLQFSRQFISTIGGKAIQSFTIHV